MWIVWLLLYLFGAAAPSAFVISPSDQINGTSAVVNASSLPVANVSAVADANFLPVANVSAVADANFLPVANFSTMVNGISTEVDANSVALTNASAQCALITGKVGDETNHQFEVAKVDCPQEDNWHWLGSPPQTVYFTKSSHVIEVTRRDVTVGSLVMLVNPVQINAVRVTRGVGSVKQFWEGNRFYTAEMLLHGLGIFHVAVSSVWKTAFFRNSESSADLELARKKLEGPFRIHDSSVAEKIAQAEADLGLEVPDSLDYEPFDDYSMENIEKVDKRFGNALTFAAYFYKWRSNQELQRDVKNVHEIPWESPAKSDPHSPPCSTSKGEAKRARTEATAFSQFFLQSGSGTAAFSSASGSGDGQDPNQNRRPTEKNLPLDKIGDNEGQGHVYRTDDNEEAIDLAVSEVVVRNANQVPMF
jgi:hypothetical protein